MIWASIDPGLNLCGVAVWNDETLVHAKLVKTQARKGGASLSDRIFWMAKAVERYLLRPHAEPVPPVMTLIIELPQTYGGRAAKGDTNDLIHLAAVVGALVHLAPRVQLVRPREWKGNVPGDIFVERTKKKLTLEQVSKIDLPAKSLEHNVYDAVALGLWKNEKKSLTR